MPRGGPRPGAGNKPGSKRPHFAEQQRLLGLFRLRAGAEFEDLVTALLESAKGAYMFLARDGDEFAVVTDPAAIARCVAAGGEHYRLEQKAPDQRALREAFDRVLGRPTVITEEPEPLPPTRIIWETRCEQCGKDRP
jgi:hypothetical protein